MDLVIGVDAGGTSTRALLADSAGNQLGQGRAAGLNQHSSGGDPVDRLVDAVGEALGDQDPAAVAAGVLGVAGAGAAGHARVAEQAVEAWRRLGIPGEPVVVTDLLTAYAAGEPGPTGSVLVAGTGAGAAAVVDRRVVRQADGAGWLLGDVGSAVWLGREALVAVVAALDGRGPDTGLVEPVLDALLGRDGPRGLPDGTGPDVIGQDVIVQDVIAATYAASPAAFGRLAPVVTDQVAAEDPLALRILERGIDGLLASLDAVRQEAPGPVVLGGALLTTPGPVAVGVMAGLAERGIDHPGRADQPAAGAAWLALLATGAARGTDLRPVHAALTADPLSPRTAAIRRR